MVLEILEKILDFGIFSEILNFLKILKIMSYDFQSRKQILTLRGVYCWILPDQMQVSYLSPVKIYFQSDPQTFLKILAAHPIG